MDNDETIVSEAPATPKYAALIKRFELARMSGTRVNKVIEARMAHRRDKIERREMIEKLEAPHVPPRTKLTDAEAYAERRMYALWDRPDRGVTGGLKLWGYV